MFRISVGSGMSHGVFRSSRAPMAPKRVTKLPATTSIMTPPPIRFAIRQPTYRPGIAALVKKGRIIRAFATRTWIGPKEMDWSARQSPA